MAKVCKIEDCDRALVAKGLCQKHWQAERKKTMGTCEVSGCSRIQKARGLCVTHYARDMSASKPTCKVKGCTKNIHVQGMCNQHYLMMKKHGDPLAGAYRMPFRKAIDHGDGTRTCTKCMKRLPVTSFHRDKAATDGIRATCKECRGKKVAVWYEENVEARRLFSKNRRKKNGDIEREKDNKRYARDREKRIALATEHSHRRKARKLNTVVEKGISIISLKKRHGTSCYYCKKEMDFTKGVGRKFNSDMATIEHLTPLSRGGEHTFENTVLACRFCNISRGAKSQEDFEEYRKNDLS